MPCFRPLPAWQQASGAVVFVERGDVVKSLDLPCGKCVGCLNERARQWSVRCMHESQMHALSCVVTLTYDDEHLPARSSLCYRDFQLFMKRLRRELRVPVRFFMSGEYGSDSDRPHYHACLFGVDFLDKVLWKKTPAGSSLFRSKFLERLWPLGQSLVGELTPQSAAYVAGYVHKKRFGFRSKESYQRVDMLTGEVYWLMPEFSKCSLKPGIGSTWFDKFGADVKSGDSVIVSGKEVRSTRYYDKLIRRGDRLEFDDFKVARELAAVDFKADNTPERLAVRETVLKARLSFSKRSLK